MMNVLIAPNAFKGSLTALEAAQAIKEGITSADAGFKVSLLPVADGGDSTREVLLNAKGGDLQQVQVIDPIGRKIQASYGLLPDQTAIIEMAEASGLRRLREDQKNPAETTSYGTGQLMQDALKKGARKILIGVGGSATVDGGMGLLQALGIRFFDEQGTETGLGGKYLGKVHAINLDNIAEELKETEIVVICDVDNPLLGVSGAAHIFGPQKGATPAMVEALENGMKHYAGIIEKTFTRRVGAIKHGGAAGGISAGLHGIVNARLVSGIDFILEYIDFARALKQTDLVITGEGKLDTQSLKGKAPYGVAMLANRYHKPVIVIGGEVPLELKEFQLFTAVFSILNGPRSLEHAMENGYTLLRNQAMNVGKILSAFPAS